MGVMPATAAKRGTSNSSLRRVRKGGPPRETGGGASRPARGGTASSASPVHDPGQAGGQGNPLVRARRSRSTSYAAREMPRWRPDESRSASRDAQASDPVAEARNLEEYLTGRTSRWHAGEGSSDGRSRVGENDLTRILCYDGVRATRFKESLRCNPTQNARSRRVRPSSAAP
jgi:hypothetical protein